MTSNGNLLRPRVLLGLSHVESSAALAEHLSARLCETESMPAIAMLESLRDSVRNDQFDLIVLDLDVLNRNGHKDLQELCHPFESGNPRTPIVFATTSRTVSSQTINAAFRLGAVDVVEIPFSSETMSQVADRAHAGASRGEHREEVEEESITKSAPTNHAWTPFPKLNGNGESHRKHAISHEVNGGRPANGTANGHPKPINGASNPAINIDSLRALNDTLIGNSPTMDKIRRLILEVAPTQATVMIHGESGTGKELVAQAIHRYSKRAEGPYVPVNMAAIPQGLAESLLFGHEKGAFTHAVQSQVGWCEAADDGTLFLDEVGEMELQCQPKLLRFLQEGTVQRVGSQVSLQVNVRVITATNRDPATIVRQGRMREDLFFRLHVVPIHVPPLRERPEDIPQLALLFLQRAAERHERTVVGFTDEAMQILQQYDWPGNVRQLENTVERLVIFARGSRIDEDDIPAELHLAAGYLGRLQPASTSSEAESHPWDRRSATATICLTPIQRHERAAIIDALHRVEGHVVDAARLLGLGQATVYRKIKQYSIAHVRKRRASNLK